MPDLRNFLAELRRPRLLVRAARHGLQNYQRERDLRRLIDTAPRLAPEAALERLFVAEERMEATRRRGDASYSIARHIEMLIALMAETRLLPHVAIGNPV